MSLTRLRRKRNIAAVSLVAAGLTVGTAAVLAASTPVPVKTSPRNELTPAAGDDWLAWSQSRQGRPKVYDVFAQQTGGPAFKVNPKGTQAYLGGIDGTMLVYQLLRGKRRSDLRLFDLTTRRRQPVPAGINTSKWECCATASGGWILFDRGEAYSRDTQMVLLRNLATGEQRVLDVLRNRRGLVTAGQVNGNFAVWRRCNPHPRCRIFRYDLATATATALPVPQGKIPYGPSVNQHGMVFYAQSNPGCGKSVQLVKQPLDGPPEILTSLLQGRDLAGDLCASDRPGGCRVSSSRRGSTTTSSAARAPVERVQHRHDRPHSAPALTTALTTHDHVFEELAGTAAGSAVDVAPIARLDLEAGALEDLRIELAAVVDHDHDRGPRP